MQLCYRICERRINSFGKQIHFKILFFKWMRWSKIHRSSLSKKAVLHNLFFRKIAGYVFNYSLDSKLTLNMHKFFEHFLVRNGQDSLYFIGPKPNFSSIGKDYRAGSESYWFSIGLLQRPLHTIFFKELL